MNGHWASIEYAPEGRILTTCISDAKGLRNEQELKRVGRLWYVPDGSTYVYYTPTHYWVWTR